MGTPWCYQSSRQEEGERQRVERLYPHKSCILRSLTTILLLLCWRELQLVTFSAEEAGKYSLFENRYIVAKLGDLSAREGRMPVGRQLTRSATAAEVGDGS